MDLSISQALVVADSSGPLVVAKSDDLPFEMEEDMVEIVRRFGAPPAGVSVPGAMFANPLGRSHITVVQFSSQPDLPPTFRFLILKCPLYQAIGDPFAISDRFPPHWANRGPLPALDWPPEAPPPRTVERVAAILREGDGSLLLGATQGLLDGVRVVLSRSEPDETTLRSVWQLLPTRSRFELWPATFAFNLEFGFHIAVSPNPPTALPLGSITEEQAKDYPQGKYELGLQAAAEHGDQAELDRLFARRSSRDTLRLALLILVGAVIAAVASKLIFLKG
jgi:hypothetical protein